MPKNSTMLPVAMVLVIVFVVLIFVLTGRTNAPNVTGDPNYAHHVCTFNRYCEGPECTRDAGSFVAYLTYVNAQPRLEMDRVDPNVTLLQSPDALVFESLGGEIRGTLTIFSDRELDFIAVSGAGETLVEHFGSGSCDRRVGQ